MFLFWQREMIFFNHSRNFAPFEVEPFPADLDDFFINAIFVPIAVAMGYKPVLFRPFWLEWTINFVCNKRVDLYIMSYNF